MMEAAPSPTAFASAADVDKRSKSKPAPWTTRGRPGENNKWSSVPPGSSVSDRKEDVLQVAMEEVLKDLVSTLIKSNVHVSFQ